MPSPFSHNSGLNTWRKPASDPSSIAVSLAARCAAYRSVSSSSRLLMSSFSTSRHQVCIRIPGNDAL